jgi:hypothetical protein
MQGGMRWCVRMMMDTRPDLGRDGKRQEIVGKFFKPDVFKSSRNEMKRCICRSTAQTLTGERKRNWEGE